VSESCEFFLLAVSLWGLPRYLRDSRSGSALLSGVGLAFLALSKYEAVPVVMVIVAAVLQVFLPRSCVTGTRPRSTSASSRCRRSWPTSSG